MNMDSKQTSNKKGIELLKQLSSRKNYTKTSLFNLVVYIHHHQQVPYFKKLMQVLSNYFPCRIMFIQRLEQSGAYFDVQVEEFNNPQGMTCEQIVIQLTDQEMARASFLIVPYLLPDVPLYLIWGQDPTQENVILNTLKQWATRLIFDSDYIEDLHYFSKKILEWMQSSSIQVIDMNWARMAGWRNIFEQTFDSKEHIDQLRACHQMKVIYNVPKNESLHHPDIQALYFQAWIATQLEWTYERTERKKNNVIFYYQTPRNAFQVILQSQSHEDLPTKEILGLELEGPNDYLCTLERQKEGQVFVNCSDQYQCELPFTLILPTLHKSHYFMQQVVFQKPSKQYKNMLHMILKMQEAT